MDIAAMSSSSSSSSTSSTSSFTPKSSRRRRRVGRNAVPFSSSCPSPPSSLPAPLTTLMLLLSSSHFPCRFSYSPWGVHGQTTTFDDVVGIPPPPSSSSSTTTSTIVGFAFYDHDADGTYDPDYPFGGGIVDVSVWLFSCDPNSDAFPLLQMTTTDAGGNYIFEDIEVGDGTAYYVNVQPPGWYALTPVFTWEEEEDEESMTTIKSEVDPSTGNTPCFELTSMDGNDDDGGIGGIGRIVNFGLVFDVDPGDLDLDVPTAAPAVGSTTIGTVAPSPPSSVGDTCPSPFCDQEVPVVIVVDGSSGAPSAPPSFVPSTHIPSVVPSLSPSTVPTTSMTSSYPSATPSNDPTTHISTTPSTTTSMMPSYDPSSHPSVIPSHDPSSHPSLIPSNHPSSYPSVIPSHDPSSHPSSILPTKYASPHPSKLPSALSSPPSVAGTSASPSVAPTSYGGEEVSGGWYGPLVMTMRGISDIEDRGVWSEATAAHVERYFNDGGPGGSDVSDVTVDILTYQTDRRSRRERVLVRGGVVTTRHRRGEVDEDGDAYAQVVYRQRSAYRTTDPDTYDDAHIAMEPFLSSEDSDSYISSLRNLSSYYDGLESVGVRLAPPPSDLAAVAEEEEEDGGGEDAGDGIMSRKTVYIIIGSACGGAALVAFFALFMYRRGRKDREYMIPVGNGPASSMRRFDGVDSESRNDHSMVCADVGSTSIEGTSGYLNDLTLVPGYAHPSPSSRDVGCPPTTSNVLLDVIIPSGKLGIVLDTPPQGGCAYVCKIKDFCPVRDLIRLEDRIIAVDDEDVQTINAVKLSKMLARRSGNAARKITVLRVVTADRSAGTAGEDPIAVAKEDLTANRIDVVAPPGMLGVVLISPEPPEPPGPAFVHDIRADSPLVDKIQLGDRIITVDDEIVREMSAEDVSKLLRSKNSKSRRISLLRENTEVMDLSTKTNVVDDAVAIRAEIITLCAALQFPRIRREEMLLSYEGKEDELLENLREMKTKINRDAIEEQNNGKGGVNG
ncbi:hypothetical protein ACHAXA_005229 [Cyclostephanos tholiformis]|uniref:Circumsporozoite protein n=1 Tax=Cyclostephanos tholiformis TaxID=382380 RepID=A0ABD3SER2_9STRA